MKTHSLHALFCGLVVLLAFGCAEIQFVHDDFMLIESIGPIAVLPVIDARTAPDPDHDFAEVTKDYQELFVSKLIRKGYEATATADIGSVSSIMGEDFEAADAAWVRALGPPESPWIMAITLDDLTSTIFIGKQSRATVTAHLFNRESGEVWWKAEATGKYGSGPLLAAFENEERRAVRSAILLVVHSFPSDKERLK